jgi:energy-coupling factor transporter ATP-binding protein EcfA2
MLKNYFSKKTEEQIEKKDQANTATPLPNTTPKKIVAKANDDISKAESLIKIAKENGDYFRDNLNLPFTTVDINGRKRTIKVNTFDFRAYLRRLDSQVNKHIANKATIETAIDHLSSFCLYDGEIKPVSFRIAGSENDIYVDIGDESYQAIKITADGWSVVSNPPVKFTRSQSQGELPIPVKGGSILALRRFLPQMHDEDFIMTVSWLVSSFSPRGPYAILVLDGAQGSGKSTLVRVIRSLLDPSKASNRMIPENARNLAINAINTWVLDFDNMSGCPKWLSDILCSIATKGTFATRMLYSDDSEMLFPIMRPIMLSGIDDLKSESDMAQRAVAIHLPFMRTSERLPEELYWEEFNKLKPALFGAVLDAVSAALKNKKSIENIEYPRMADFCRFSVAATAGLPWKAEDFLSAYSGNINNIGNSQLEGDPVASVIAFMMREDHQLILSATEVFNFMEAQNWVTEKVKKSEAWPKTVNSLKSKLTRVSTFLAAKGIEMNLTYRDSNSIRKYKFINHNLSKDKAPRISHGAVNLVTTDILNQMKSSQSEITEGLYDGYESVFDENGFIKD